MPTSDIDLPEGGHSTSDNFFPRTFYVELGLASVPEPTTAAMLGLSLGGLLISRRRRDQ